jgi:hypothetical protein
MQREFRNAIQGRPPARKAHVLHGRRCGHPLKTARTTSRRGVLLLLLLACLSWQGCAGLDRSAMDRAKTSSGLQAVHDQERVELERELTLYSD